MGRGGAGAWIAGAIALNACADVVGADFDGLRARTDASAGTAGGTAAAGGGGTGASAGASGGGLSGAPGGEGGVGGTEAGSAGASGIGGWGALAGAGNGGGGAGAGGRTDGGAGRDSATDGTAGVAGVGSDASDAGSPDADAPACAPPMTMCGPECVDTTTSSSHCGDCNVACSNNCVGGECCGDGALDPGEDCDGSQLGGATCGTAVAPGWVGTLQCSPGCAILSTACAPPSTTYNALGDSTRWSAIDLPSLNGNARGYFGGAFDGRYVYLSPYERAFSVKSGLVPQLDVTNPNWTTGWVMFDAASLPGQPRGYSTAAFDGTHVYFVPREIVTASGLALRYTAGSGLQQTGNWATFDAATVSAAATGFIGAVFDGRFLYFVPTNNGVFHGNVARYDTEASFAQSTSWQTYDTTNKHASARGFVGGTYDGRYVYLVPYQTEAGYHGFATRYDTTKAFGADGSWEVADTTVVNTLARGYQGAVFDGRYVYYVPLVGTGVNYHGVVSRYDTTLPFADTGSWATFDIASKDGLAEGFCGGAFDGRYVYFVPYQSASATYNSRITRFDTTQSFTNANAWTIYDLTGVNANAKGFRGAVFDGRYLYLVPWYHDGIYSGLVLRFDAKSPSWLPQRWNASFF